MTHSSNQHRRPGRSAKVAWGAAGLAAFMATSSPGCSDPFESCEERRSCEPGGAGGAHAGAPSDEGGAGADSAEAGARANGGNDSAGAGGVSSGFGGASAGAPTTGGTVTSAGSAGLGGEGGTSSQCAPLETRSCREGGALGACAAGQQLCTTQGTWGPCNIMPAAADTCESGNDANCNGSINDGCPCLKGATRSCADGGYVGKCATGTQTCGETGSWGTCSIAPAAQDSCDPGNNDNCAGPANEGCACIVGTARACGACEDGTQTCINGKTGQYSACTGAVLTPTTWYRDADGDGYGSAVTTTVCSATKPAGYTDKTGDCCDDGGNLTLAAKIHPGQMDWFQSPANICGLTWDYDCSNKHELQVTQVLNGCASGVLPPNCSSVVVPLTDKTCGTTISTAGCAEIPTPPSGTMCGQAPSNGGPQGCH